MSAGERRELTGQEPDEITRFLSTGLLVNVLTAFGVLYAHGPDLPRSLADWAENLRGAEPFGDRPAAPDDP